LRLERVLQYADIPHVAIREPDAPWNNQLMAIGLVPGEKHVLAPFVCDFHMLPDDLYHETITAKERSVETSS
jgi:hypothetical protein